MAKLLLAIKIKRISILTLPTEAVNGMSKSILSISVDNLLYNRWMNREKQRVSMRKQAVGN